MAFRMAQPWKDPKTGTLHLRQRVPLDLIERVKGQNVTLPLGDGMATVKIGHVVQVSLRTKEVARAKELHAVADAALRRFWEAQRHGPRQLSMREAAALAGTLYRDFSGAIEDDPGSPELWAKVEHANLLARAGVGTLAIGRDAQIGHAREARFGDFADLLLAREGLVVDAESRTLLTKAVQGAMEAATAKLKANASFDYSPDPAAQRFPEWKPHAPVKDEDAKADTAKGKKLTLSALFDRWADHPEQEPVSRRTKARYRGVFGAVATFLNNPDALAVTLDDLTRYVDARMNDEGAGRILPKVARDVHKAALSSVYGWAKGKRIVPSNPAEGVTIKVAKVRKLRKPEASDAETAALMKAVLALPAIATVGTLDAAKRYAVLIALYTGCRIGEATQLRKEDIATTGAGKLPMLHITPEAGDVKDKEARTVPVHGRLVELGLLSFVDRAPAGPLFYGATERRKATAATPAYELVARDLAAWSRDHGLGDPLLKRPMHALRHRFTALARAAGMEGQYMRAITGHAAGDQSEEYGSFSAATLHREIARLRPEIVEGRGSA